MQKLKQFFTINRSQERIMWILMIAIISIYAISINMWQSFYQDYINLLVNQASAQTLYSPIKRGVEEVSSAPKKGSIEWVYKTAEEAGIDPIKVKCLIKHESGFNPQAIGINGDNTDIGLYQFSSKYQIKPGFISLECATNVECATYKFIEKVKADGNMNAWHGYTRSCAWLDK
jgi:hypothetical protein